MAAGKWKLYNTAKEKIGQALIDLDGHSFKCALFTSTSNANTLTNTLLGDLTNQVSNGNGYTTNGVTLTSVTWTNSSGTITFDGDIPQWLASGSGFSFKYAVIFDDTVAFDPLLAVCDLNVGGGNLTANSSDFVTITIPASGIFNLSGATTD